MKFSVTFKKSLEVVAYVEGIRNVRPSDVSLDEVRQVIDVERILEKLTGLRVHVEQTK